VETTFPAGLAEDEAARRRAQGQGNLQRQRGSVSIARILRRNVFTILNGVLFGVSLILLALGLVGDALVTAGPVALNVTVSVYQELSAKRKLDQMTLIHQPQVRLRRAGRDLTARPTEIVLGDTVILERGDQAVVDGTILTGSIELDESVLTGESEPTPKVAGDVVRSGSICVSGSAAMEVTAVGDETFAGRLAREARGGTDERTPLRRDMDTLILAVGIIVVAAAIPVGISLRAAGEQLLSPASVQAAAVLVALVPQGLAIMSTVVYAMAAVKISRSGAIVQRIDAIESMSRVDTLCLDKTGTLTTQRLVLETVDVPEERSTGVRSLLGDVAASASSRNRTLEAVAAAVPGRALTPLDEVAFSSARGWSSLTLPGEPARTLILGAPELITDRGGDAEVARAVDRLTALGQRVLLFAEAAEGSHRLDPDDRPPPARVLAVLGFREELRPDASQTLDELRASDIELKVVSGDHPVTVAAVAGSVGIPVASTLSGPQIEALDDADLAGPAAATSVFGRIRPDDKRRLVVALRSVGRYVAMTGDGVNDVLALRRAQLGIAMESGSAAARAVAAIVLLGDRFEVLPRAIVEGRRVVAQMIAVSSLLLARTVYMLLIVVAAALLAQPFPFTPKNNAVLSLVTVGIPTLVIALWVPPIRSPRSVVAKVLRYAIPSGVVIALISIPVMLAAFGAADVETGRSIVTTMTVFSGIALIPILFPPAASRSGPIGPGGDVRPTVLAVAMLVLYALIVRVPIARDFFDLRPLPFEAEIAMAVYVLGWMAAAIVVLRLRIPERVGGWVARRRG